MSMSTSKKLCFEISLCSSPANKSKAELGPCRLPYRTGLGSYRMGIEEPAQNACEWFSGSGSESESESTANEVCQWTYPGAVIITSSDVRCMENLPGRIDSDSDPDSENYQGNLS